MTDKILPIEQVLAMLAEGPPRIAALTAGLAPGQLHAPPAPGDWSVNDVLAHLRSCADVWGECIAAILAQDRPTLRAVNPRTWIKKTDYLEQDFQPSLQAYTKQRAGLVKLLTPLTPEDWSRAATVTGAGKVLERSVLFYGQWLARHEQPHLKQIQHITKTQRMSQ